MGALPNEGKNEIREDHSPHAKEEEKEKAKKGTKVFHRCSLSVNHC
jgi:hypothetical protein